jgi:peptidoglycan/xylan/chitin deacetylase (PgdA/CDA1 family)
MKTDPAIPRFTDLQAFLSRLRMKTVIINPMIRLAWLVLLVSLSQIAYGDKQLAVTIDDLPFLYGRYLPDSVESDKFRQIQETLRKHHVRVIGFVVGCRINAGYGRHLDEFVAAGHVVGNHTYTHPDLNSTTATWYENDIIKGREAIRRWAGPVRYFRYPFLHQGPTESKYRAIGEFLRADSSVNVPVTIDNDDWLYNKEYTAALKNRDSSRADSIGRAYIAHMQERTLYFDSLATAKLRRDVKHILLIHMTELNSVYLDRILTWYEDQGWRFIPPQEALTDSIYQAPAAYIGSNGTSWLLRLEP